MALAAGAGAWGIGEWRKAESESISAQPPPQAAHVLVVEPPEPPPEIESAPPEIKTHIVRAGDTLSAIAVTYNIDVGTILSANPGTTALIHPGDELKILPEKGVYYEVKAGDTLWRIGRDYNITVEAIVKANNKATDQIVIGESIFIPGARYARVESRMEQRAQPAVSRARPSGFSWPAGGQLSSPYGWRWGRMHTGIDIANELGAPVVAAAAGQVIWAGVKGGYGYTIIISHGNGYTTLYGHLNDFFVARGQQVRRGQRIGSVGNTGNSTGPHLHFEILVNGEPVDPMRILP